MNLRRVFSPAALALCALCVGRPAEGTTAALASLPELASEASFVVVGTPREHFSAWVALPSGRRIVTYTRVTIEQTIAGDPGDALWVRTLGGVVGDVGQLVSGEAQLRSGGAALLFLTRASEPGRDDVAVVTEMAQGCFPIVRDASGVPRVASAPDVGMLLARPGGPLRDARALLLGVDVREAAALVREARVSRAH